MHELILVDNLEVIILTTKFIQKKQMNYWNQYPLFRLLLPFTLGILSVIICGFDFVFPLYLLIVLIFVVAFLAFFTRFIASYRFRWFYGFLVFSLLFIIGSQITIYNNCKNHFTHFEKYYEEKSTFIAQISEPIEEREKSNKTIVKIVSLKKDDKWLRTNGKAIFYFEKDSLSSNLNYGDKILCHSVLNEIQGPQNPSEFNYKRYLSGKQIFHMAYLPAEEWAVLSSANGNIIKSHAIKVRKKFLQILNQNEIQDKEFAVLSALLLGYRAGLDDEILNKYTNAGATHILCVSGLHVGIIYLLLNSMLLFLNKRRFGKILKAIILILMIWSYAMITGMAPSVLRASTMFSFIIIGNALKRYTSIYNSLAVSALILLSINPFIIMEVGFQLSYAAVISIIAIQPMIYRLYATKIWILNKAWQITTVSIAAQIGTFPISIYYFHQFPNYFILTNLIVIPLAGFIIYAGIVLLLTSSIAPIAWLCSKVLYGMLWFMNTSVGLVDKLPGATSKGISLELSEVVLLIVLIFLAFKYFSNKFYKYFRYSLLTLIIISVLFSFKSYRNLNQKKFVVYNIRNHTAIDFIDGKSSYFVCSDSLMNSESIYSFNVKNNWTNCGIIDYNFINDSIKYFTKGNFCKRNNYLSFYNKRVAILNKNEELKHSNKNLKIDYLIVSGNPDIKIENILEFYQPELIIFDSSNKFWVIDKWKTECEMLNVNFYSVNDSGAFVRNY
ncbi:MAG: ComEC family competence protein [Saprospiraceae bacterium]|nr:ComEC family competence protein [Saprospiraceae bacterium]